MFPIATSMNELPVIERVELDDGASIVTYGSFFLVSVKGLRLVKRATVQYPPRDSLRIELVRASDEAMTYHATMLTPKLVEIVFEDE